jgi:hypothetical protein
VTDSTTGNDASREAPYRWAGFHSGDGEITPAFRCRHCRDLPSAAVIALDGEIPEVLCRCAGCGYEWRLFLTHLQALRLAVDPPPCDWLTWASPEAKAKATSAGMSAALGLSGFVSPGDA